MKRLSVWLGLFVFATASGWTSWAVAQNQTTNLSPVLSSNEVPFTIQIEQAAFSLPSGLQSYVVGTSDGKWLLLAGRIGGLHGFNSGTNNFPPDTQNTTIFVVDPTAQTVATRSLTNLAESGMTQTQIDLLSVTAPQWCQSKDILYMSGGYGVDESGTNFTTKDALTAIDIPGMMHWVVNPTNGETAVQYIRQIFQITGGVMVEPSPNHVFLVFGQDFEGANIFTPDVTYSEQVRQFRIIESKRRFSFVAGKTLPATPDPDYRRAGLNVVPIIENGRPSFAAFSGSFTTNFGIWTIPVEINSRGVPTEASPTNATTFMQGMNNFNCPTLQLYSQKERNSYTVLMGGISFGFFATNGAFETDAELPFINQVTTIKRDRHGVFSQYLMNAQYPVILSTESNPGNQLLFGSSAVLIPTPGLPAYRNGVLNYDRLKTNSVVVGYIIGGIQSTLPNTNVESDSAASPYIFKVTLIPTPP